MPRRQSQSSRARRVRVGRRPRRAKERRWNLLRFARFAGGGGIMLGVLGVLFGEGRARYCCAILAMSG